jgi:hypothetical protein
MPDPSYNIPEHFPRQFSELFNQSIQQSESKFRSMLDAEGRWSGKQYVFRNLSQNTWTRNDTRGGSTVARESAASFRSCFKKKVEAEAIEFYEWDEELLAQIVSPKSSEMEAMKMGYERAFDDLCIEAAFEDSYGGPDPHVTAQVFPTSQIVPVNFGTPAAPVAGTNQPFTPWKILRAKKMFMDANIDLDREELCIAISPAEIEDLMVYVSTSPNETWAKLTADFLSEHHKGNKTAKLFGATPIVSTRLATTTTGATSSSYNIRKCIAFLRSAFVKSATEDVKSSMDRIPQDKNKLLLQGSAMVGIGRRYDEKIIQLPCEHLIA